ncbi:peptide-methionine (S)-S-oxide reductase MsrA [Methylobrevis pamukkalensis]|uniref:Peptide methionine sulfoxide reductase MsrA n=1 Tax=Methylobrevis pamukkalensis TaxID=1439726 RepID=A0A1E3H686_9HYPH|nr:peptide-methionine (S)-S-oxide reductase MsrA [Methylobrevis pamukkalensis]ODN71306.1 Peptide methionine sulfoxide reductase MsrA [Methylobrevis pamukkalensis]
MFLADMLNRKLKLPTAAEAMPGRAAPIPTADFHFVNHRPLAGPWPEGYQSVVLGLGCFWGAERKFWQLPGVWVTSVGYIAGLTPNPTYQEVCSGLTGHNEVVQVVFDPAAISFEGILKAFWESHDPTQGMRQGNDTGTQYRSGIYVTDAAQRAVAERSRATYQEALARAGRPQKITTEIVDAGPYYYAEAYHQQYLAKNPNGYCGLGGTGVSCPLPTGVPAA